MYRIDHGDYACPQNKSTEGPSTTLKTTITPSTNSSEDEGQGSNPISSNQTFCVTECPQGYYKETEKKLCNKCQPQCKTCENGDRCVECLKYQDHNGTCVEKCPDGTKICEEGLNICNCSTSDDGSMVIIIASSAGAGGAVVVIVVVVAVCCCWRKRKLCFAVKDVRRPQTQKKPEKKERTAMSQILEVWNIYNLY